MKFSKSSIFVGMLLCGHLQAHLLPRDVDGQIHIQTFDDLAKVYPKTIEEMEERVEYAQGQALEIINQVIVIPKMQQNKDNVLHAIDTARGYLECEYWILNIIKNAYCEKAFVKRAFQLERQIRDFSNENITCNASLYKVVQSYANMHAQEDNLTFEQWYFLNNMLNEFKRNGAELAPEVQKKMMVLKKQEATLGPKFVQNITNDNSFILVEEQELAGVSEDFIKALERDDDGKYILVTDYPTASAIFYNCYVESTRKKFEKVFCNRGYPANEKILKDLIDVRDKLAKSLGFKSYAHFDISPHMAKTPERVCSFHRDMKESIVKKACQEFKEITKDLPEDVSLTRDGKLKDWDSAYVSTYYKKKHYDVDEQEIAEYFPMDQTIRGLLDIYEKFFNLKIETIENPQVWHSDVRLVKISEKSGAVLSYVFLDMHPRKNKFTHAMTFPGVMTARTSEKIYPTVSTMLCNFTKPTNGKPSLLSFKEVKTFFHEFGHAIHCALAETPFVYQSSPVFANVDFLELPSLLLENWIENKEVLRGLTHHYKTGKSMPDELIDKKLKQLKFGKGMLYARQVAMSYIALECFGDAQDKDAAQIYKKYMNECVPYIEHDEDIHDECSFGHLGAELYGSKYYSYLWAQVFADDVFAQIEKEGLLNPEAGSRYRKAILAPGASKNPDDMLRDYLGREPNKDAFFKKIGL